MYKANKSLGQHFLKDQQVIFDIVKAMDLRKNSQIVEIGPGTGALTQKILQTISEIHVIEIDGNLIPILKKKCSSYGKIIIYNQDVLSVDFHKIFSKNSIKLHIVGNLPYNVASPILFYFLNYKDVIGKVTVMLQKEMADRVVAPISNKTYGRLSVMMQYHFKCKGLFNVSRYAFSPIPKIESRIVQLIPIDRNDVVDNYNLFSSLVRHFFQQRRKKISNSLKFFLPAKKLHDIDIDLAMRPENLSVDDFILLSNLVNKFYLTTLNN